MDVITYPRHDNHYGITPQTKTLLKGVNILELLQVLCNILSKSSTFYYPALLFICKRVKFGPQVIIVWY